MHCTTGTARWQPNTKGYEGLRRATKPWPHLAWRGVAWLGPCRYLAGEQVLLCYGKHTNLELLEHYGFVLQVCAAHGFAQ